MHININDLTRKFVDIDLNEPGDPLLSIGVTMDSEGNVQISRTWTDHYGTMRSERLATLDSTGYPIKEKVA